MSVNALVINNLWHMFRIRFVSRIESNESNLKAYVDHVEFRFLIWISVRNLLVYFHIFESVLVKSFECTDKRLTLFSGYSLDRFNIEISNLLILLRVLCRISDVIEM